jgi:hypothetical protein
MRLGSFQKIADNAGLLTKIGELDRWQAHHTASGMASSEAKHHASGSDFIDGGDGMDGDRRDAVGSDRNTGRQLDFAGIDGAQRHAGVDVAPNHLRVGEPCALITAFFEPFGIADCALWLSEDERAEFHRSLPAGRPAIRRASSMLRVILRVAPALRTITESNGAAVAHWLGLRRATGDRHRAPISVADTALGTWAAALTVAQQMHRQAQHGRGEPWARQ